LVAPKMWTSGRLGGSSSTERSCSSTEYQDTIAKEIVEYLELCNWKIEQGLLPLGGHGSGLIPKKE